MKKLLLALLAAGFASATVGVLAADKEPYTAQPKIEKPGRAADDTPVKSGAGVDKKFGRAADDTSGTAPPKSTKKHSKKKKSTTPPATTDAPKQ